MRELTRWLRGSLPVDAAESLITDPQKVLEEVRERLSGRGRSVRSSGERPPTTGVPTHRR
jgi:hypothetical protein